MSRGAVPAELLENISLHDENIVDRLSLNRKLGFITIEAGKGERQFVGFHADEQKDRGSIVPAIEIDQREKPYRVLSRNAKGVGIVLGNSPEAIDEMYAVPGRSRRFIGVWVTPPYQDARIAKLAHKHPAAPWRMVEGVSKHAGYIVNDWLAMPLRDLMKEIEKPYGEADLALIDPAPTWLYYQWRRGINYPILPPRWALYRDRNRQPLERIGMYQPPGQ